MTSLAFYVLIFVAIGAFFLFIHMVMGSFIRPSRPDSEKLTIYECGEPTVGSAWMQFDIRYYVVALLFVIFDVEVAFFFPWAIVFGSLNEVSRHPEWAEISKMSPSQEKERTEAARNAAMAQLGGSDVTISSETPKSWAWVAFLDILVFFGVLMVGFAYLWRRGDIDWVRSTASEKTVGLGPEALPFHREGEVLTVGAK